MLEIDFETLFLSIVVNVKRNARHAQSPFEASMS